MALFAGLKAASGAFRYGSKLEFGYPRSPRYTF
jgi:hypothetical protein